MSASRSKQRLELSQLERRFAMADLVLGRILLAIAGGCVGVALLQFVILSSRSRAPLDSAVWPLVIGIVPAGVGGLLLLAALAMQRHTEGRWVVQCGAFLAPVVLAFFIWLSK